MNTGELAVAGTVLSAIGIAFLLGMGPVFVVRLIARVYPKGHDRRAELVAEMAHVQGLSKTLERWHWLGEQLGLALCEGIPGRLRARERVAIRIVEVEAHYADATTRRLVVAAPEDDDLTPWIEQVEMLNGAACLAPSYRVVTEATWVGTRQGLVRQARSASIHDGLPVLRHIRARKRS